MGGSETIFLVTLFSSSLENLLKTPREGEGPGFLAWLGKDWGESVKKITRRETTSERKKFLQVVASFR